MGKVSKKVMNRDIQNRMFEIFWKALASLKSHDEARRFWQSFISDVEQLMLAKRLGIALMLAKGFLYQEIKDTLKVSSSTIMDVSVRYKIGNGGIKPALNRILKEEATENFWDNIEEFFLMISPQAKYGSYRHQKRQEKGKKIYENRKKRKVL